jgi:hypothetical protein
VAISIVFVVKGVTSFRLYSHIKHLTISNHDLNSMRSSSLPESTDCNFLCHGVGILGRGEDVHIGTKIAS